MKLIDKRLEAVTDLHMWSTNCLHFRPWFVFLDLIGWTTEAGGYVADWSKPSKDLGCLELDYLAEALKAYALYPQDVFKLIHAITVADLESGLYKNIEAAVNK